MCHCFVFTIIVGFFGSIHYCFKWIKPCFFIRRSNLFCISFTFSSLPFSNSSSSFRWVLLRFGVVFFCLGLRKKNFLCDNRIHMNLCFVLSVGCIHFLFLTCDWSLSTKCSDASRVKRNFPYVIYHSVWG